jgi:Uma2 family endonuclease
VQRSRIMSAAITAPRATVADLARVDGKAELIGGVVVQLMPTGHEPNQVAGRVFRKLAEYVDAVGKGFAYTDNMGFTVPELSTGRQSFSPDVAYFTGRPPAKRMRFVEGAPDFAVEVRSESDYGSAAETAMAAKRAEYFEAGTKVVWDVDPEARIVVSYKAESATPTVFRSGEEADAEPAVPGWRISVDWLMK